MTPRPGRQRPPAPCRALGRGPGQGGKYPPCGPQARPPRTSVLSLVSRPSGELGKLRYTLVYWIGLYRSRAGFPHLVSIFGNQAQSSLARRPGTRASPAHHPPHWAGWVVYWDFKVLWVKNGKGLPLSNGRCSLGSCKDSLRGRMVTCPMGDAAWGRSLLACLCTGLRLDAWTAPSTRGVAGIVFKPGSHSNAMT